MAWTSRFLWELQDFSGERSGLQRTIGAFLMLLVNLPVIEERRREGLSRRNFVHGFLIGFEQRKNHRGHLPSYSAQHLFLATILSGSLVIGAEAREQALIDSCPLTIKDGGPRSHQKEHLFH